jgi:hypothetical protein
MIMARRQAFAGCLLAVALAGAPTLRALAQAPEAIQPNGLCFEVVATYIGTPDGAILLNRCGGQTWILVRTHQPIGKKGDCGQVAYRWSPITTADTQVAITPPAPPRIRAPKPAGQTSDKCFTFQGRRFCE